MDSEIIQDRKRKAFLILEHYNQRNSQQETAIYFKINIRDVRRVVNEFNRWHTTDRNNKGNRLPGQRINMFIDYNTFDFLDKYNF